MLEKTSKSVVDGLFVRHMTPPVSGESAALLREGGKYALGLSACHLAIEEALKAAFGSSASRSNVCVSN